MTAHEPPDQAPMGVAPGDAVVVEPRHSDWPAFAFVRAGHGEGWVPFRCLSVTEGAGTVVEAYDTTELSLVTGQVVFVLERDDASGWLWCRDLFGKEGWVPVRATQPIE